MGSPQMEKLIEEESAGTGQIKLSVLKHLLKAAEWLHPCVLLVSVLLFIVSQCMTQLWLSEWSRDQPINGTQNEELINVRLGVYGGLAILQGRFCHFAHTWFGGVLYLPLSYQACMLTLIHSLDGGFV